MLSNVYVCSTGIGGYHFIVYRRTPDPDPVLAGDRHGSQVMMTNPD